MFSFFALAVVAIGMAPGTPEAVQWQASYGKALETTRAEERPLLVILDNPAAEGARVSPDVLSPGAEATKQLELLSAYERCHVDVTTEYGQKVAAAFKATTFPYMAVIDKTGSVIIYSKTGQTSATEWEKVLSTYKTGDRSLAATRVTYSKPVLNGSTMFQTSSGGYIMGTSSCPTCQQRSF
jgi:hypothetical protein